MHDCGVRRAISLRKGIDAEVFDEVRDVFDEESSALNIHLTECKKLNNIFRVFRKAFLNEEPDDFGAISFDGEA